VTQGTPCLGPVTQAGCGAICPSFSRGCYGCFGPSENANVAGLAADLARAGVPEDRIARLFGTFNANAEGFREVVKRDG